MLRFLSDVLQCKYSERQVLSIVTPNLLNIVVHCLLICVEEPFFSSEMQQITVAFVEQLWSTALVESKWSTWT